MPVRVNRYLASTGLGSRRAVEDVIRAGRVTVNGEVAGLATVLALGGFIIVHLRRETRFVRDEGGASSS